MKNITYYEDDNVKFIYTDEGDSVILHCSVFNWKLSVLKKMYSVFSVFLEEFKDKNIISISSNPKFCELLGGKEIGVLDNGMKVMIWELK